MYSLHSGIDLYHERTWYRLLYAIHISGMARPLRAPAVASLHLAWPLPQAQPHARPFVNSYICTRLAKPQPGVPTDYMNLNRRWAMQRALHGHADVHKGTRCEWAAYLGAPVSLQVPSMLGLLRALRRGLSVPRTITVDRISVPPNRSRTRRTSGPNRCARRRTGAVTPYRRVPHFAHPACPCRPPSPLFCVLC